MRAAEDYFKRKGELEESPIVSRAEHVERMTEAQVAAREGVVADLGEPTSPVTREATPAPG